MEGWERLNDPAPDFSRTVDAEVVIEGFHFHSRSRSVIRVVEDTPRARSAAQHRFVEFGVSLSHRRQGGAITRTMSQDHWSRSLCYVGEELWMWGLAA